MYDSVLPFDIVANGGSVNRTVITHLEVKNLSVGFDKAVMKGLSFAADSSQFISLDGPTGGGKSVLLRTLSGLIPPIEGQITMNHTDIGELSFEEFLPLRLTVGVSFDLGGLLSNQTLWDNLMLPLLYNRICNFDEAEARADRLVSAFGIGPYKTERPANVPGGIRKAACVARAFILDPSLIFLDEPTTGLNSEGLRALDFELGRVQKRKAIVMFSSRDEDFKARWATSRLHIEAGRTKFEYLKDVAA